MRIPIATILGLGLLASLPASAKTDLSLSCTTRGLTPGARVWIEVEAQYQPQDAGSFRDVGPRQLSQAKHVWSFEVPQDGVVAPTSYQFTFPAEKDDPRPDRFGSIYLKTRFRIDDPRTSARQGFGEITEVTFGLPVPPGATRLSRCLRLNDQGDRLTVETAADCLDTSFDKASRSGYRVHGKAPTR
jgi:hypothetical protein